MHAVVLSSPLHSLAAMASTRGSDQLYSASFVGLGTVLDTSLGVQAVLLLCTKSSCKEEAVSHAGCCKPEVSLGPMTVADELIALLQNLRKPSLQMQSELADLSGKASTGPLHMF